MPSKTTCKDITGMCCKKPRAAFLINQLWVSNWNHILGYTSTDSV